MSTGDILRDAIKAGSALGKRVRDFLDSGALVPDELMAELIADRGQRVALGQGALARAAAFPQQSWLQTARVARNLIARVATRGV